MNMAIINELIPINNVLGSYSKSIIFLEMLSDRKKLLCNNFLFSKKNLIYRV